MNEIKQQLSSPAFWAFGFFFAIVLNIGSSYLKSWMDEKFDWYANWRRQKNTKESNAFDAKVLLYKKDSHQKLVDIAISIGNMIYIFLASAMIAISIFILNSSNLAKVFSPWLSETAIQSINSLIYILEFVLAVLIFVAIDRTTDQYMNTRRAASIASSDSSQ